MAQQDTIDALATQLDKARDEIVAEIGRLEDLVASGGGEQLDFTAQAACAGPRRRGRRCPDTRR
ncbi:hypothetical protein [Nocardia sp. CA-119907]|uniref:hypothetical protein n=1 Tax=Nocardia sp. CA-119907 TaxID=3239973 RepID=UPI003D99F109